MIRLILCALLALALPSTARANDLEGAWALRIDDANIFVFEITQSEDGEWHGTWKRPASFASNGAVFARLNGSEAVTSMAGLELAGDVELSFDDPAPGAIPDIFRFRLVAPGQALLTYVGTQLAPFPLVEVAAGSRIGPFDRARLYDRDNAATRPDDVTADEAVAVAAEPAIEAEESVVTLSAEEAEVSEPATESLIGDDFLDGLSAEAPPSR